MAVGLSLRKRITVNLTNFAYDIHTPMQQTDACRGGDPAESRPFVNEAQAGASHRGVGKKKLSGGRPSAPGHEILQRQVWLEFVVCPPYRVWLCGDSKGFVVKSMQDGIGVTKRDLLSYQWVTVLEPADANELAYARPLTRPQHGTGKLGSRGRTGSNLNVYRILTHTVF